MKRETFEKLERQWREETMFDSMTRDIVMSRPYQRIIGHGKEALPHIFASLRREPAHWFWALEMITGEDPVPEEHRGRIPKMIDAWLEWAEEHGYTKERDAEELHPVPFSRERFTRNDDESIDEVVLGETHIEQMDGNTWSIRIGGMALICSDLQFDFISNHQRLPPGVDENGH